MSLFQTRLVLSGIADSRTLESISLALGEYDRQLTTSSVGQNHSGEWLTPPGQALLLEGADWRLIELTS